MLERDKWKAQVKQRLQEAGAYEACGNNYMLVDQAVDRQYPADPSQAAVAAMQHICEVMGER